MSTQEREEDLRAEIARLRARVEELERRPAAGEAPREAREGRSEGIPYETIMNALPHSLVVYSAEGTVVALNDNSCTTYGTTRELIVGNYNILQDPEANKKGYADGFRRALAGEVATMAPSSYETPGGPLYIGPPRLVWSQAIFFPIRDERGVRFVVVVSLDVTALKQAEAKQRQSAALLEAIIENAPLLVYVRDAEGRTLLRNRRCAELLSQIQDDMQAKPSSGQLPSEVAEAWIAHDMEAMNADAPIATENQAAMPDGEHVYMTQRFALRDDDKKAIGVCGIILDITERVRAEEKNRQLREEMLRAREETLRAISMPLLPIADGVLVVPVVGEVTRERAEQLIETLLRGVASQRARITILDVTGVPEAGTEVINALVQAARGVRLLGAEIVLTGIRPSVAQTLVGLNVDLGDIATRSTLERGVAYALAARHHGLSKGSACPGE